ncbi:Cyclin-dependent kinase inhibitor 1B [Nibea albiflora]|uniref:Cyclin-dependent kinase inhibitor 1B n=1 Tax=Nibea albiflora TaxID=240163 RepID=A0ACB7EVD1_NIBAL|nr:Cyclin-dependent kinase inhibitor 1B [Nibea albiflora]
MSDVRLSNASPTLERVDARQPDNVRPPVRRSLFGSPDREGIRRYFAAAMQEDVQDFMDEYNFDPVNDRPLTPRNYDWQEDSDAPEFFRRPPHQRDADSPGDNSRQDAEESSGRQSADRRQSLGKRRSGDPGPCSSECQSKRSHTDEDDDEDEPDGAASQAVRAAEERPSRPEKSAEVQ